MGTMKTRRRLKMKRLEYRPGSLLESSGEGLTGNTMPRARPTARDSLDLGIVQFRRFGLDCAIAVIDIAVTRRGMVLPVRPSPELSKSDPGRQGPSYPGRWA
jgi:hypothetical protein